MHHGEAEVWYAVWLAHHQAEAPREGCLPFGFSGAACRLTIPPGSTQRKAQGRCQWQLGVALLGGKITAAALSVASSCRPCKSEVSNSGSNQHDMALQCNGCKHPVLRGICMNPRGLEDRGPGPWPSQVVRIVRLFRPCGRFYYQKAVASCASAAST